MSLYVCVIGSYSFNGEFKTNVAYKKSNND